VITVVLRGYPAAGIAQLTLLSNTANYQPFGGIRHSNAPIMKASREEYLRLRTQRDSKDAGADITCMRFLCGPRLLVIDEFAYARRNPDPEANTALFEVISRRYLKSSTILTSHTGIAGWGERLGDPMLAAAVLDRVLHTGIVVSIDGPSYRMRAHQQRSDALRRALHPEIKP
jgi:hypothetical protein